mmetsp:Transcript_21404/g.42863  ORF Transcript_21404/g.42863 Transcript_21404/m.42863 type:complete len:90 (-) Transcript_21404:85-354(-)
MSVDDGAETRRRRQMQSQSSAWSVTAVQMRWRGEASPTTMAPEEAAARRQRAADVAAERERARQVRWCCTVRPPYHLVLSHCTTDCLSD